MSLTEEGGKGLKRILMYAGLLIFVLFIIPIAILGGVGGGVDIPSKIFPNITPQNSKESIKIKVYREDIKKVEEMDLEDYLVGVLAAEMPAEADPDALKAQAIAARTYAVAKMKQFGGSGCPKHPEAGEYDVCSDVHCQAWKTKEERFKSWDSDAADGYWAKLQNAVKETAGMALTYKGRLASAIKYHASSGGKTENSLEVFGYAAPYLVSVPSEYEADNPKYTSTVKMSISDFVKKVKEIDSKTKISTSNLASQIKVIDYTDTKRIKVIQIGDKKFSGDQIRWGMDLNSTYFTIKADSKNVTFNVKGSGHGVGMPQWGAMEMAKAGKKYDEILKHYYTGVEINTISEIFKYKIQ